MFKITLIAGFASALLCPFALAQGLVNINNNFTPPGGSQKAFVRGLDGNPFPKALGSVEVLTGNGVPIKSGNLAIPGIFGLGVVEIPGTVPGGDATIIIRVWDNSTGSTYETASSRSSVVVTLRGLGGGGIPPPGMGTIGDFTGIYVDCFCPAEWTIGSEIMRISPMGDQIQIMAAGSEQTRWTLMSSTNLVDWVPVGTPQKQGYRPWLWVHFDWVVPEPSTPTLYRVDQMPE